MIVITGATGTLGRQVVDRLLERVSPDQVAVSVRDLPKAAALAERGVRVRRGDFAEPSTLPDAFEGADQVLVVSSDAQHGGDALHRAAFDAARAAGARRVLYTSHQGAAHDSLFAPMTDHARAHDDLRAGGAPFTALRNGFYASTVPFLVGDALSTGTIAAPADGPVSWTTHADLAAAAARVLTSPGLLDGVTPPLTAPAAIDLSEVAAVLSDLTGRTIERVVVDDAEWAAGLVARGLPAAAADFTLGIFRAARRGEFAVTDPALEQLLGRPATTIREHLAGVVASS